MSGTSNSNGSVELDEKRNFALTGITLNGVQYISGGIFPQFTCINVTGGIFTASCTDSRWKVLQTQNGISYAANGLEILINYSFENGETLKITTQVLSEGTWRLISVGDNGGLISLPQEKDVAFVSCADGGRLYHKPTSWRSMRFGSPLQANFIALLNKGSGLILHPEHNAYTIGFGGRNNKFSMGCEQFFRPSLTTQFAMPLCHKSLSIELIALPDMNSDGETNWVDAGVLYRDRYIKQNMHLDPALREGVCGKLPWSSATRLREKLLQLRQQVKGFPVSMWILAPVGPSSDFLPSEPLRKEWSVLKKEMDKIDIRLSPHDNLDDMAPEVAAADPSRIRWNDKFRLMPAYKECFRRSLNDDSYIKTAIDARLKLWSAQSGDTWHIDVFSHSPFEDYCPEQASTFETDFCDRYKWLSYIHDKRKIHVTSEFLGEGYHEVCDYGWWSLMWKDCAPDEQRIPLLPVLFLGRTYYGTYIPTAKTWVNHDIPCGHPNVGESLVWGVKVHTQSFEEFAPLFEQQNRYWSKIADKTVKNIVLRDGWWTVYYTDGAILRVQEDGGRWEEMRKGHFVLHD